MSSNQPKLFLAPMEGVTDWVMRDLLTSIGGIDHCVTEFLRVTDRLHPYSVFEKNCPELKTGSRTRAGTPVFIQLLGGQAGPLAENAARAAEMKALGIDLNFGCPAKTVNRHDGGAALLRSTDRIYNIVKTVREAVPKHVPVTAKIRLGFDNPEACLENAKAVEEAGATWLTVHCRTKTDGYKPPAYWEWIPKIKEKTNIRLITNGEIWTESDFEKCHSVAQTSDYMIGRGAIRDPFIFAKIKKVPAHFWESSESNLLQSESTHSLSVNSIRFPEKLPGNLILHFFEASVVHVNEHFAVNRSKGWLRQLAFAQPHIKEIFNEIKVIKKPSEFRERLEYHFS